MLLKRLKKNSLMTSLSIKRVYFLIIFSFLIVTKSFSQGPPGGGGGGNPCQTPFTPCWCAKNPIACANQNIPINNELWVLIFSGGILGVYFLKKHTNINTNH
jgi:hypothetical protein